MNDKITPHAVTAREPWFESELIHASNEGYAQGLIDGKALAAAGAVHSLTELREALAAMVEAYDRNQYHSWEKGAPDFAGALRKANAALSATTTAPDAGNEVKL